MRLDGVQDDGVTRPLPGNDLIQSHGFALQVWVVANQVSLLGPHDGTPGRIAVSSGAAIPFFLTIKGEGHL